MPSWPSPARLFGFAALRAEVPNAIAEAAADDDEPDVEAGLDQAPRDGTVVVSSCLKGADHWLATGFQRLDQAVVLGTRVKNGQTPPSLMVRRFDQHLVPYLRNIDGYQRI